MSDIVSIGSSGQFSKLLSSNSVVVADFYADWCGPCKAIAPTFAELAKSTGKPGKVAFAKVDVDSQQDIAQQYAVSAMPTFKIFKNGSVVETIRGANPGALKSAVAKHTQNVQGGGGSSFAGSKGNVLGSDTTPSRTVSGSGMPDFLTNNVATRFVGMYLETLLSLDAYGTAENSKFKAPGK